MKLDVEIEEIFHCRPEALWKAITDPAFLGRWLMPGDFEPRVGKRFTLVPDHETPWAGNVACEVLELVPPRRMVWSWQTSGMERPTRVSFELTSDGDATRLSFRHAGEADEPVAGGLKGGWPVMVARLREITG